MSAALRAAQEGDEDGFRWLYRGTQPRLLRYLRVLVGDEAEDMASDTWLQISRDVAAFRGDVDDFRAGAVALAGQQALRSCRGMASFG